MQIHGWNATYGITLDVSASELIYEDSPVAIILEQEQMKTPIKINKVVWLADVKFKFP